MKGSKRRVRGRWFSIVWFALPIGCSGRAHDQPSAGADEGTGVTEPNLVYCDGSDAEGVREHYRLAVINRKLAYYPELAAELGLSSVKSCEEARSFRDVYLAYSKLHPGFDADQPLPPMPDLSGLDPDGPLPTFEGPKLLGGKLPEWSYPNAPIVKIARTATSASSPAGGDTSCTGTFIGPSFVLAAAHCLAAVGPLSSREPKDLTGYPTEWQWEVHWPDSNGVTVGGTAVVRSRGPDVLQVAHPDYMGSGLVEHDLALLYLYPRRYASILPPVHGGGAMRLSLAPPQPNVPTYVAGFASRAQVGDELEVLRSGQALLNNPPTGGDFTLEATIKFGPGPEGQPAFPRTFAPQTQTPMCSGDSGSPAYRIGGALVRRTPGDPGTVEEVPVLLGVLHGTTAAAMPGARPHPRCSAINETDVWARTDDQDDALSKKLAWIKAVLALWGQSCKVKSLAGQSTDNFVQCWGDPCNDTSNCAGDEYCRDPGTETSQCVTRIP